MTVFMQIAKNAGKNKIPKACGMFISASPKYRSHWLARYCTNRTKTTNPKIFSNKGLYDFVFKFKNVYLVNLGQNVMQRFYDIISFDVFHFQKFKV